MPYTQTLSMSDMINIFCLEWWNATESAKVVVRHLVSLVSELRYIRNPVMQMESFFFIEQSLKYHTVTLESGDVFDELFQENTLLLFRKNMVMCHSFAHKYSVDAKVLLERVAKQITGENALQLISRIRVMLMKNDEMLTEISKKAQAFFGTEDLQSLQKKTWTLP